MSAQRWVAFSFLVAVAACAPRTGTEPPRPIAPEDGPNGSLHVRYSGGILYRTVDASFRVDQFAYVVVGHLGGDGVIRVLYPASPLLAFRPVRAKQSIPVRSFTAGFDGAPSLFSQGRSPFRNLSAMMDSYDGRGHGFVFMIATRSLMYIDEFSDGREWDELDVRDYMYTSDPRVAIREFADRLTGGDSYTLKFANSFSTQSFASYASSAYECSLLSSLGYGHLGNFWGTWGLAGLSFLGYGGSPYSGMSGCGSRYSYYSPRYAYYDYARRDAIGPRIPTATPGQPQPPPMGPITPVLTRPTQRAFGEASRGVFVGRSAFDRRPTTVNSGLQRQGYSSPGDGIRSRPSASGPSGMDADRPSTRSVDRARAYTPRDNSPSSSPRTTGGSDRPAPTTRGDSPKSTGGERSSPAPRAAPAPAPKSNPPSAPATKTTGEVKHQQ